MPDRRITQGDTMRMIKECRHCGREFQGALEEFCSYRCVRETS